ncbi:MAG: TraR/DksA C4-type zinc finger protein [Ginsengibacter sp.]
MATTVKKVVKKTANKNAIVKAPQKKVAAKKIVQAKKMATGPAKKANVAAKKTTVSKKVVAKKTLTKQKPVVKNVQLKKAQRPVATNNAIATKAMAIKKANLSKPLPVTKKTTDKSSAQEKPVKQAPVKAAPQPIAKKKEEKIIAPAKPLVLPKMNTKTAKPYNPEFTKSVLDPAAQASNNGPSMRYSDVELNEFRELIQRKLDTAKKELGYLQGLITRKDEMGGDETDNRYMTMEDGSLSMEREQLSQMASRQITFIDHLEKATMRIENKTYGICRVTGKLIDKARLRAVPHATLSMEAKMGNVK